MRREFVRALVELGERDRRVVLLTGDLGYMALEPFAERFPDRFFNVGVAEQNMLGLATGLAEAGYVPFAYSIATFASMRPYEFLRTARSSTPSPCGWWESAGVSTTATTAFRTTRSKTWR